MSIMMWICFVSCHAGVHNGSPGVPKCTDGGESSLIPVGISGSRMCLFDVPENGAMPSQVTMKDSLSHGREPSQTMMQYKSALKMFELDNSNDQMTIWDINHGTMPSQTQDYSVYDKGGVGTWLQEKGAWFTAWSFQAMNFGVGGLTRWTDPPPMTLCTPTVTLAILCIGGTASRGRCLGRSLGSFQTARAMAFRAKAVLRVAGGCMGIGRG